MILWADTFNNYFYPRVAAAATEILEDAGFHVIVPKDPLCCGRPLYDYGFLDVAERQLREILTVLRSQIEAGTPMVGLEPSCLAVFRDEMPDLMPHDEDAKRLRGQCFTLAEFLNRVNYRPPKLKRNAIIHGHCHQKALIGLDAEKKLFHEMGLSAEILDDGCCGMAGSFGFEEHKYDVSMKVYEHVLGPHMRRTPKSALVVADGFSCKTQIEQASDRHPLHLAQVLQMAKKEGPSGPSGDYPERDYLQLNGSSWQKNAIAVASVAGIALGGWFLRRRIFG